MSELINNCEVRKKCGGCRYAGLPYGEQLKKKQQLINSLLHEFAKPEKIIGMQDPVYYRNKVHHAFGLDRKKNIIHGVYEPSTHKIVPVKDCLLEDRKCQEIIETVAELCRSFKIKVYDEISEYGLLRHVLVRKGFQSGEIMCVLVLTSPVFPSKNNFVKALREKHPEITTVIFNINDERTSMVLGKRNITVYGPGTIKDRLCGLTFRISPDSFFQVNPMQTEILYRKAIEYADLKGTETVIDAYCGTGTIGLCASAKAGKVLGIELNRNAVSDAILNARENGIKNVRFIEGDAGAYMERMAEEGYKANVLLMDPPRTGSTEKFLLSAVKMAPQRIVYISCGPETLKRDLQFLTKKGYRVEKIQPVDNFPWTEHVETVCLLSNRKPDSYVHLNLKMEDYYRIKDAEKEQGKK